MGADKRNVEKSSSCTTTPKHKRDLAWLFVLHVRFKQFSGDRNEGPGPLQCVQVIALSETQCTDWRGQRAAVLSRSVLFLIIDDLAEV